MLFIPTVKQSRLCLIIFLLFLLTDLTITSRITVAFKKLNFIGILVQVSFSLDSLRICIVSTSITTVPYLTAFAALDLVQFGDDLQVTLI